MEKTEYGAEDSKQRTEVRGQRTEGKEQRAWSEGGRLQDARFKMQGEESSNQMKHRAESEGQKE